ncbi:MAG TPA: proteasome-type protease [Caulobacteraceae bacterium]|jgi:putative proteasome-type protease|nr:proteasome-type protease [Caulobacteraceae bacterium]
MTYCLGIVLPSGVVMASDSRSNAGVDQVASVKKMALLSRSDCVLCILSAGNLATSQAVVTPLTQAAGTGDPASDLLAQTSMFDAARLLGERLRAVTDRDAPHVAPYGDATASFLLGGQVGTEAPRLFQIYSAGNFVEASERSNFLQIGETKYGKPILDRALTWRSSLDDAAKLALLSFDATLRSNLSVGLPIDLFRYEAGSFSTEDLCLIHEDTAFWRELTTRYGKGLSELVKRLTPPPRGAAGPPARAGSPGAR